ncbi:MAG TPA: exo-alpha-sialidase [Candidatus Limnocylindria bacterium]|nr:exo-alpha-sialidase [Candidatus Limnocylindria bacterium]
MRLIATATVTAVVVATAAMGPLLTLDADGTPQLYGGAAIAAVVKGEHDSAATVPGQRHGESDRGPGAAADEAYANRAYPAASIAVVATQNAQRTFEQLKQNGRDNGSSGGNWTLLGPSTAREPGVLTFTGADAVTSGRITALAVDPGCTAGRCTLYAAAAGGGIWKTTNATATTPNWKFISESFKSNAIGTIVIDPTDRSGRTLYAGTGEPNASGDSEAGVGVYRSTDGGDSWSLLSGSAFANGRSVSSIAIDPTRANVIYVATTRGVRGVSSVTGGTTSNPPGAAPFGLYRSSDGGATFSFVWDGAGSVRGVNHFAIDPRDGRTLYGSAFQQGLWRSTNGAATFQQVFAPTSPTENTDRTEFALTVKSGHTRIYVGDGSVGNVKASVWRADSADTFTSAALLATQTAPAPGGWKNLTNNTNGTPGYATSDYCTGQCWYDNVIATPAGYPDVVFVAGSFAYGELGGRSNARAVVRSTTAGEPDAANGNRTFTDMTNDATSSTTPNGIHPDQHAIAFVPGNPNIWFNGSDGGVVRSSGTYADVSAQCGTRLIGTASMITCRRLLSAVPARLISMNAGLSTLQFQSLSLNPKNPTRELMGGTQDNGTWLFTGNTTTWDQTIYGDGGQSGFDAVNPTIRFNTFFSEFTDTNFRGGDPTKWVVTSGPLLNSPEGSAFYMPIIADPVVGGTMFVGLEGVWRTKDNGGNRDFLEANCPEFTTPGDKPVCGDWVRLGATTLTDPALGKRSGGVLAAVERTSADHKTLWAATSRGRVFVTKNADAEPANSVTFTRIDTLATNAPGRFVSSIYVDPANANHAWISYSGYNFNTPTTPGHVFDVRYNPVTGTATWTDLHVENGPAGELPITDLVRYDATGELFAATDFGVVVRDPKSGAWTTAGDGLPAVEVAGLTISQQSRTLYAATHGRGAWQLNLAEGAGGNSGN